MNSCPHPEMSVYIKPHPPKFLNGRKMKFCYYKKGSNSLSFFYFEKRKFLVLKVDDLSSIEW
ncbi:hypothetical protein A1343_15925 [Leptospira interrogans serovar Bataviae]|nr:hypothetical protein [Leptospira interrogans serovar Bataviae]OAM86129.1 hypothetical protein A1343_15925 [Leptospira interrogans serovar Bataviae]QOI40477.1 hypothetical protein Lepto1548_19725 [Leptospira interrogans serovar Bataviae]